MAMHEDATDRQDATDRVAGRNGRPATEGYPAESARQGHIVLRSRARRRLFVSGLAGLVLLLLLLAVLA